MKVLKVTERNIRLIFFLSAMLCILWYAYNLIAFSETKDLKDSHNPYVLHVLSKKEIDEIVKLDIAYARRALINEGYLINVPSLREILGQARGLSSIKTKNKGKKALYEKASAQGDYLAQNNLGVMLYNESKVNDSVRLFEISASVDL